MAVSTIKASGGDFTSLISWESSKQAVLSALEEAECYDFADSSTSELVIFGWTTSAANFIRIYTPTAERHNGTSRDVTGSGFQLVNTGSTSTMNPAEEFLRIEGIDIKSTGDNGAVACEGWSAGTSDMRFDDCIMHDTYTTASTKTVLRFSAGTSLKATLTNCIIYGKLRGAEFAVSANYVARYCTFYSDASTHGVWQTSAGVVDVSNCYSGGYSTVDFQTGVSFTGSSNASSDTTATTNFTTSLASKAAADQFVNVSLAASANFHLKAASDLEGAAENISGVTTDIDGDARHATAPDIGADEFVAAGGVTVPIFEHHYRSLHA